MKKPQLYKNPINNEQWLCDDPTQFKMIDGIKYIQVRKPNTDRSVLIKLESLIKIPTK